MAAALRFKSLAEVVETCQDKSSESYVKGQTQVFVRTGDSEEAVQEAFIIDGNLHFFTKEAMADVEPPKPKAKKKKLPAAAQ